MPHEIERQAYRRVEQRGRQSLRRRPSVDRASNSAAGLGATASGTLHRARIAGVLSALFASGAIAAGSRGMVDFDPALLGYAIGAILAVVAAGYRLTVWADRPPSRMYFRRGLELIFRRGQSAAKPQNLEPEPAPSMPSGAGTLGRTLLRNFIAQDFIRRRSTYRWVMHLCLSGGCTMAFAITFPLVFGWVHFESPAGDAATYRALLFGVEADRFSVHSLKAFVLFNALNFSAILVLAGLVMAGYRRLTDSGERATQTFFEDILPLLLIFAVTATGLALTVSYRFLEGRGHSLWAFVHMISVVSLLIFIPFGKLFHILQRTCSLCVSRYKLEGAYGPRAHCRRCGDDYSSQMQVDDLKVVLDQLGFNYRFGAAGGKLHYQDICPACRRRLLGLNQGMTIGR